MSVKFSNNAVTTLSASISAGATSFTVASASLFPTLASGDWTYVSLTSEVVKVTAISGTTFTCDATSNAHASGESVELRMTAELLNDFAEDTEALPKTGGAMTGAITTNSTFDGRDVATDGTKLDTIATSANNYSHPANHAISVTTGLQAALDSKAPLASPALTGVPTAPTATANTNTTQVATTAYVQTEVTDLIGGAPGTLDTLNELAAAINDDASYASTLTTALGTKTAKTSNQSLSSAANALTISGHTITLNRGDSTTDTVTVPDNNTTYSVGDGGLTQVNFTTADNTKLDGIEAGATADQTGAQILALFSNSITAGHIAANAIGTSELGADAVTSAQLANNAINSEHYADGSIDRAHLAADVIDSTKLANDSVNSEHYVNGSVDDAHISGMAASKLTGTIADARFPSTLPAISGANLTGIETVTKSATAPSSPAAGDMWFNSSASTVSSIASKCMASYSGTEWLQMSNKFSATGGTESTYSSGGVNYKVHTFTSSGTFTANASGSVDYLVVAGGGGGGADSGGGAGAGGYRSSVAGESSGGGASAESKLSLSAGSYTVTIGAGGTGSINTPNGNAPRGPNGQNSVFASITSTGGGGGGPGQGLGYVNGAGASGGSGGGGGGAYPNNGTQGAGGAGTSGQGYSGAAGNSGASPERGGGGAGAGGAGTIESDGGGDGGVGVQSSITGSAIYRAGGGGGGAYSPASAIGIGGNGGGGNGATVNVNNTAGSGQANTGGGGGSATEANIGTGGNGGSGIVIVRYEL